MKYHANYNNLRKALIYRYSKSRRIELVYIVSSAGAGVTFYISAAFADARICRAYEKKKAKQNSR